MENTNIVEMTDTERIKPYKLNRLEAVHIMPMVSIIRKIGLKELKNSISEEKIKQIISAFMGGAKNATTANEEAETSNDTTFAAIGISILPTALDIVEILLVNLENAETDIFKFLASVSNLSLEQVKHLSLADVTEMIFDVIQQEEFKDFYKVVSKFFK